MALPCTRPLLPGGQGGLAAPAAGQARPSEQQPERLLPNEAHSAEEVRARPRPGRALQSTGITAQSCRLAPALRPEAPGGQGLSGQVSPGTGREEDLGLLGHPYPRRAGLISLNWTQESTLLSTWEPEATQGRPSPPGSPRHPLYIPLLGDPPRATGSGAMVPPSPTQGGRRSALC